MNIHQNARLTPKGRALLVRRILAGETPRAAASPKRSPYRPPPSAASSVAPDSTVSAISNPPPPVRRYEHHAPGELLHLDIKRLGRFQRAGHRVTGDKTRRSRAAGWEFVHVAVDDHSRIAFSQILPDERSLSAAQFLLLAHAYYGSLGIRIRRLLTDNGSCYRSRAFRQTCRRLGIRHRFTRPYTPRTNGKAERFIQTALREWAYARSYLSSLQRADHLLPWLHDYNGHRPHASLGYNPPISRLPPPRNNLLRLHS